jgi:viroplasmin and RNaseH domain-containing protein
MAWYVVHVGRVPGIYQTWRDCHAQVHRYPGNCYKKYNTQAEALRAYNGVNIQNNNDQELVMEIEEFLAPQNEEMSTYQIKEMSAAKNSFLGALLLGLRKMLCF